MSESQAVEEHGELCQRCGERGEDRRTLRMDCFYAMEELKLPFGREMWFDAPDTSKLKKAKDPLSLPLGDKSINITAGSVTTDGELIPKSFYILRVCKDCRSTWMSAIQRWFNEPQRHYEVGSGIFVRRNGANVEVTEEEWHAMNPEREPVRAVCPSCHGTKKILEDHDGRAGYRPCSECT